MRDINTNEIDKIVNFCIQENIDLAVIGPEAPSFWVLLTDLMKTGLKFGPSAEAAMPELRRPHERPITHNIPTAAYGLSESGPAKAFIDAAVRQLL